jgi:hypothetical protein
LYWLVVDVAVIEVVRVISVVEPVGLVEEPYTVVPSSLVTSSLLVEEASERRMVRAVMVSEPDDVLNMKESTLVAEPPGAIVTFDGSTPVERLVIGFGVTGFGRAVEEVE